MFYPIKIRMNNKNNKIINKMKNKSICKLNKKINLKALKTS